MRETIDFLKKHKVVTGAIGVVIAFAATKVFARSIISEMALLRIVLTMAMSMFVYLISGEKSFENCHTTTGYVIKWGMLTIIPELLLFFMVIFLLVSGEKSIVAGWSLRLLFGVIACVFVGLFEELTFRVLINDALLYSYRNKKNIFIWIAIISSFVFGIVHVIGPNMFAPQAVIGTALKTLSAALGGLCWLILYWKTRNLWGVALVHGIGDFVSFFQSALTEKVSSLGGAETYAETGEVGYVVYLIQAACSLVALIILWKKVGKTIDFEDIRRNW